MIRFFFRRSFILFLILFFFQNSVSLRAQVQHEGKPLFLSVKSSSAEMDYLLPPPDSIEIEAAALKNTDKLKKSLTFAIVRDLDISPAGGGEWSRFGSTDIWRVRVISPGAWSLGVNFRDFRLVEGDHLFVYDATGNFIKGSYDYRNNKEHGFFSVAPLPGEEVIIELQAENGKEDYGSLVLSSVSHAFLPVPTEFEKDGRYGKSGDCEIDINCWEGQSWQTLKRSVCRIYTTTEYCTGALVNNTARDGTPYVLTAEHCVNAESVAQKSVFIFNYESASCFGEDGSVAQSVSGSSLKATGGDLDFTLLLLNNPVPDEYKVCYAGWDLKEGPPYLSNVIHHPQGDVKKVSMDYDYASIASTVPGDLNDYIASSMWRIYNWDFGSTEGGSSGAPLFNIYQRIVGTLTGGAAYCGDSVSYNYLIDRIVYDQSTNVNDYFTRIGYVWNYYEAQEKQLKHWLDPGNTGQTYLSVYDPYKVVGILPVTGLDVRVYPNPASDYILVELGGLPGITSLKISDLSGKVLLETDSFDDIVQINVDHLGPGMYLLNGSNSRNLFVTPFIIAR